MCVSVCECIFFCIHIIFQAYCVCVFVCVCVCVVCACTCVCVRVCVCVCVCMLCACVRVCVCACVQLSSTAENLPNCENYKMEIIAPQYTTQTNAHTHTHTHTHIPSNTHTHTHTSYESDISHTLSPKSPYGVDEVSVYMCVCM